MLYFDSFDKLYYWVTDASVICLSCNTAVRDYVVVLDYWDKHFKSTELYCIKCSKINSPIKYVFNRKVLALIIVPSDCPSMALPVMFTPEVTDNPLYQNINFVYQGRDDSKIVDKTVYASRESFEGLSIGSLEYLEDASTGLIESQAGYYINKISDGELELFLEGHKNSIPEIAYKKQKQIEEKK